MEGVQDALGAFEFAAQAAAFGGVGPAEAAEERGGLGDGVGPDGAVAGVVGCLRATGRVTQAGEGFVRGRGAGEFQAERAGRVDEPAVVRDAEVQRPGSFREQVAHVPVAVEDPGGGRGVGGEFGVDVGEQRGQVPGAGPGGHDLALQ